MADPTPLESARSALQLVADADRPADYEQMVGIAGDLFVAYAKTSALYAHGFTSSELDIPCQLLASSLQVATAAFGILNTPWAESQTLVTLGDYAQTIGSISSTVLTLLPTPA